MSESAGHRPDVNAGTKLRGGEVPEVVKAHAFETEAVTDPDEEAGDVVGSKRRGAVHVRREDEGVVGDRRPRLRRPLAYPGLVLDEERNTNLVQRDRARAIRFCGLLGKAAGHDDDRAGDLKVGSVTRDRPARPPQAGIRK